MMHRYKFSGLVVKFVIDPEIYNIQVRIENAAGSLCATAITEEVHVADKNS